MREDQAFLAVDARSWRQGRQIVYAVDITNLADLIAFLMKDWCGGRPEFCAPAVTDLTGWGKIEEAKH